jgi:uncharacterized protein YqgV (UPF0045/DUF77 family)
MTGNQINAAIQVLPQSKVTHPYAIVDEAIDEIRKSGLKYKVCPFETVVEGPYNVVMDLIEKINSRCFSAGADELLVNIKLQVRKDGNVSIDEKTGKYS